MASTEVGHHTGRVYRSQEGKLIVPDGASIELESSGVIRNKNIVVHTSGNATLSPTGVSILNNTIKQVFLMKAPSAGDIKEIVKISSAPCAIRLSTGAVNAYPVRIFSANSSACVVAVSTNAITSAISDSLTIKLNAISSSQWLLSTVAVPTTQNFGVKYTVSSST